MMQEPDIHCASGTPEERQIATLRKKLRRCEQNRLLTEKAKDSYDRVHLSTLHMLDAQRRELMEKNAELEQLHRELQEANERLYLSSITDPLTGVNNRRRMTLVLAELIQQANGESAPFCVMLLDLDHFKQINDKLGHNVGDEVLIRISDVMRRFLPPPHMISRWGGEEFLILMPEQTLEMAKETSEALLLGTDETDFPQHTPVAFSAGVVQHRLDETFAGMMQRVDNALYEAKRTRHCIVANP